MKFIPVWSYTSGGDDRSHGPIAGYCSSESLAKETAKGKGWYGGPGHVKQHLAIQLNNGETYVLLNEKPIDLDGTEEAKREKLKEQALSNYE